MRRLSPLTAAGLLALLGLAVAAVGLYACNRGEQPPNVLLITIDTLRADHLSPYGFKDRETPTADALAREGALFEAAHCDVTWTTSSMASTLTGTYALRHGLRSSYEKLAPGKTTIAEILKRHGYQTGAVIGSYPLDSIFGLDRGFDVYDDTFTAPVYFNPTKSIEHVESKMGKTVQEQAAFLARKGQNDAWRPDDEVTDTAGAMLEKLEGRRRPFFLWVHYFGPHIKPNMALEPLKRMRLHVDSYPDKIVNTDYEVGRLLEKLSSLGLDARTLVILHADHGEALGEHKWIGHGKYLYEDNLRIPLLLRWPGHVPAGKRVTRPAANVDIVPTILEAAGIAPEGALDGVSLFEVMKEGAPARADLYAETYLAATEGFAERFEAPDGAEVVVGVRRRGVFSSPWKYIVTEPWPLYDDPDAKVPERYKREATRVELYNLAEDPGELNNLAEAEEGAAREKRAGLAARLAAYAAGDLGEAAAGAPSAEHVEKLKSLGYVE